METREVPEEIQHLLHKWVAYRSRWWAMHYILGITATVASITVASQPQVLPSGVLGVIAWVAALAVALITFLIPSRKARAYVTAARALTDACNRYRLDENFKTKHLLDAAKEGENIISTSDHP